MLAPAKQKKIIHLKVKRLSYLSGGNELPGILVGLQDDIA